MTGYPSLQDVQVPAVVPSSRRLGYRACLKLVMRKSVFSCPVDPVDPVIQQLKKEISGGHRGLR
jgi:hypothetical protein